MPIRDQQKIRMAAAAGRFFEAEPLALRRRMAEEESKLTFAPVRGTVKGAVLPHAGYLFSLATAMKTLAPARGMKFSRAVLLGPSHYVGFHGIALSTFSRWRTPFGDLSTDTSLADAVEAWNDPLISVDDRAHLQEHSLEVEFPLLQYFFENLPVLPLVVGTLAFPEVVRLGRKLAELDSPETLWIVSSDFTHYGKSFNYVPFTGAVPEKLRELDLGAAKPAAERDLPGFANYVGRTGATICGALPIALFLAMLEAADPDRKIAGRIIDRSDSGEVTGDYSCVVDYVGILYESIG